MRGVRYLYVVLIPFTTSDKRLNRLGELREVRFGTTGDPQTDQRIVQGIWHDYEEYFKDRGIFAWAKTTHRIHVLVNGCACTESPEQVARACEISAGEDNPLGALVLKFYQNGAILHGIEDSDLIFRHQHLFQKTSPDDFSDQRFLQAYSRKRNRAIISRILFTVPVGQGGIVFFHNHQWDLLDDPILVSNFDIVQLGSKSVKRKRKIETRRKPRLRVIAHR